VDKFDPREEKKGQKKKKSPTTKGGGGPWKFGRVQPGKRVWKVLRTPSVGGVLLMEKKKNLFVNMRWGGVDSNGAVEKKNNTTEEGGRNYT